MRTKNEDKIKFRTFVQFSYRFPVLVRNSRLTVRMHTIDYRPTIKCFLHVTYVRKVGRGDLPYELILPAWHGRTAFDHFSIEFLV